MLHKCSLKLHNFLILGKTKLETVRGIHFELPTVSLVLKRIYYFEFACNDEGRVFTFL